MGKGVTVLVSKREAGKALVRMKAILPRQTICETIQKGVSESKHVYLSTSEGQPLLSSVI